jgi:acetyltransferase-like isoleucine patch superfamily enzyme
MSCAYIEARYPNARICIGDGSWINDGFGALAEHTSIWIGGNVFIGVNVEIIDSDGHGLNVDQRHLPKPEWAKPVDVENDVLLGRT